VMAAARSRRTRAGRVLGARERLGARAALALVTTAAGAALAAPEIGRLVPRGPGDAIVVPEDPLRLDAADLARLRPTLTVVAGRVVWRA